MLEKLRDPCEARALRELAARMGASVTPGDDEIVARLVSALTGGGLRLVVSEPLRPRTAMAESVLMEAEPDGPTSLADAAPEHWCEVQLVDEAGQGVSGQPCVITTPDGRVHRRYTDSLGFVRITGIAGGACMVSFPDIDATLWRAD